MIDLEEELDLLDQEIESEHPPNKIPKWLTKVVSVFYFIMIALLLMFFIVNCIFFRVLVPTASMAPTISVGEQLLVQSAVFDGEYSYGDILVFESDESDDLLVKRMIGKAGDKIDIVGGVVYRNGKALKEEEYLGSYDDYSGSFQVPEDCYFFLGDNRVNSNDSRYWVNPYIKKGNIKGRVAMHLYPKMYVCTNVEEE